MQLLYWRLQPYYYGHYFMYMWCSYSDLYARCLCLILYHVGSSLIYTCFLLMHSNIHVTTVCSRVIGVIIAWFPQLKTWEEPGNEAKSLLVEGNSPTCCFSLHNLVGNITTQSLAQETGCLGVRLSYNHTLSNISQLDELISSITANLLCSHFV